MSVFEPKAPYKTIEEEFEARTRKAFTEHPVADYVVIDSRRQQFQAEMVAYCQKCGWLDAGEFIDMPEQQWAEWRYRLTPVGREHFSRQVEVSC